MAVMATYDDVEDFITRNEEWIRRELKCAYGISFPHGSSGYRLALRIIRITPALTKKIDELRQMAAKENIELDVCETGVIRAL